MTDPVTAATDPAPWWRSSRIQAGVGAVAVVCLAGGLLATQGGGSADPASRVAELTRPPAPPAVTVPPVAAAPGSPGVSPPTIASAPSGATRPPASTRPRPAPLLPGPRPKRAPTEPPSVRAAWAAAGAKVPAGGQVAPAPGAVPVRIDIPGIGVSAPVDPTGLDGDGTMKVPENFARTSWYTGRPVPGQAGPAVIIGHNDNRSGPAVFYRLSQLRPGQEVRVTRADGFSVAFVVERSIQRPKKAFPTEEVYGDTPGPTLRLITCGGSFDRSAGHYRDNTIVFLRMKT